MAKNVVVTGVSTGIGYAIAKDLVEQGYHVWGSVRKQSDAERLAAEFGKERFTALQFDVTDAAAIQAAAEQVGQSVGDQGLAGLVNNAGIAVPGPQALPPPAGKDHQHQLGWGQNGDALSGSLCSLETCAGGDQRQPAPRTHALWHRCNFGAAGHDQNTDLGQGSRF